MNDLLESLLRFRHQLTLLLPWAAVIECHFGQTYFTLRILWKKDGVAREAHNRVAWNDFQWMVSRTDYLSQVVARFAEMYAQS